MVDRTSKPACVRAVARGTSSRWRRKVLTLGSAFVLAALLLAFMASTAFAAPAITSDLPDYPPGATVTLYGTGWAALEPVHVEVRAEGGVWGWSGDATVTEDGTFVLPFNLPDWFVTPYYVNASGPISGSAPEYVFTDAAPPKWDQMANNYNNAKTPPEISWINGILNTGKADYVEGMSVPQRLVIEGIDTQAHVNDFHYVTFQHQFTKSKSAADMRYAYDFITSWDQAKVAASNLTNGAQLWDDEWLWLDLSSLRTGLQTHVYNPQIPTNYHAGAGAVDGKNKEHAYETTLQYGARSVRVYSTAELTDVEVVPDPTQYGDPDGGSFLRFDVRWKYKTPSSTPANVMVVYGSHIAVGVDPIDPNTLQPAGIGWGPNMGASSISGGPYHNSLKASTEFSGASKMDNQLMGDAVDVASAVEGYKWDDANRNGFKDLDEDVVAGCEIWLDINNNGVFDSGTDLTTTTDSTGKYRFYFTLQPQSATNMRVYEVVPAAHLQTYPGSPAYHSFTLSPGDVWGDDGMPIAGVPQAEPSDFGNTLSKIDVAINKRANLEFAARGQEITYTITVTNKQKYDAATNVVVTDILDPHEVFVRTSEPLLMEPLSDPADKSLVWNLGFLAADGTKTFTVTVMVDSTAPQNVVPDPSSLGAAFNYYTLSNPEPTNRNGADLFNYTFVTATGEQIADLADNGWWVPTGVTYGGPPAPAIAIDKVTVDGAVEGDGIEMLVGEAVTWKYRVSLGSGNVPLHDVTVDDNMLAAADDPVRQADQVGNNNNILEKDEIWLYTATGTTGSDAYSNTGTATGYSPQGSEVTASDTSSYTPIAPVININKVTVDGTTSGDGLKMLVGEAVKWRYTVTNGGTEPLNDGDGRRQHARDRRRPGLCLR